MEKISLSPYEINLLKSFAHKNYIDRMISIEQAWFDASIQMLIGSGYEVAKKEENKDE